MTSRADFGNGDGWGGGAATGGLGGNSPRGGPWWNYPSTMSPGPRVQHLPGHCWGDVSLAPNGELWAWPVPCGPFPPGSHLGSGDSGPENP